jgi:hypothetical protein
MRKAIEAVLSESSERYADWMQVFGTNRVEVLNARGFIADLPGKPQTEVYLLNLHALSEEQSERLVLHLAEKFDSNAVDVAVELERVGLPILAEDVCMVIDPRFVV